MNRGEFITLLEDPSGTDPATIMELDELIGIFPYFQGAYMLLLKVLKENTDIRFEKRLKQNAIYVADRALLYRYLMDKPKESIRSGETNGNGDYVEETVVGAGNTDEPLLLAGEIESIGIDGIRGEEGDDGLLVLDDNPEEKRADQTPGIRGTGETARTSGTIETPGKLGDVELIDRFIAANPRISPLKAALEEQELADISRPYTENTENTEGLVSETLAKIYIKQKYYYRAIDIYEKLSLNYPEKNLYFASQIQMIKDLINQK